MGRWEIFIPVMLLNIMCFLVFGRFFRVGWIMWITDKIFEGGEFVYVFCINMVRKMVEFGDALPKECFDMEHAPGECFGTYDSKKTACVDECIIRLVCKRECIKLGTGVKDEE